MRVCVTLPPCHVARSKLTLRFPATDRSIDLSYFQASLQAIVHKRQTIISSLQRSRWEANSCKKCLCKHTKCDVIAGRRCKQAVYIYKAGGERRRWKARIGRCCVAFCCVATSVACQVVEMRRCREGAWKTWSDVAVW